MTATPSQQGPSSVTSESTSTVWLLGVIDQRHNYPEARTTPGVCAFLLFGGSLQLSRNPINPCVSGSFPSTRRLALV